MKKKFKLIKELPWLKVDTIIKFDTEYEEIWIEDKASWYKQPNNWQYQLLLGLILDLVKNKKNEYLREILTH